MPVVKVDALAKLAAALAALPGFPSSVEVQQAPSAAIEAYPNVAIVVPSKLVYDPAQRILQQDLGGGNVVFNVGAHEGPIQIRIVADSTLQRSTLEQLAINLLLGREGSPGVLPLAITSTDLVEWVAAFEFEDSSWSDVNALEREYEAIITCNAVIPALVVVSGVTDIDTLILGMTEDFATTFTPTSFSPPLVELVQINADGSISPA